MSTTEQAPTVETPDGRRLNLLGGFSLCNGNGPILASATIQRLLALLALHGPTMSRLQMAGLLWPEKTDDRALANLRSALWRVHGGLDPVIESDTAEVSLRPAVHVDVHELERRCLDAPRPDVPIGELLDFAQLRASDLLPGWYDEWVTFERERLRQVHLYGLEALTRALRTAGRSADAVLVGLAVIAREPLRESAHRLVIQAHLDEGNVVEARRQFELCRGYLRENLGIEPSPSLGAFLDADLEHAVRVPRVRPFAHQS